MYLAQCAISDITFIVNMLTRFSSKPTRRHWNGIKYIFLYFQGIIDLRLFYPKETINPTLVGYTDAGYKF